MGWSSIGRGLRDDAALLREPWDLIVGAKPSNLAGALLLDAAIVELDEPKSDAFFFEPTKAGFQSGCK